MAPTRTSILSSNQEDLLQSKVLHADTWTGENDTFFSKLSKKDHSVQPEVVDKYLTNWKYETSTKSAEESKAERKDAYKAVVNSYYDRATDFYEYGWGTSFHFCRFRFGESFQQAMARHEHYLASRMGILPGMKVLDVGCAKLDNRCEFVKGDFMHMPFEDNTFDAIYAIEATVHASSLEGVYGETYRVLKPGGNGIPNMRTEKDCRQALQNVGFDVKHIMDLVEEYDDEIKWYSPLQGGGVGQRNFILKSIEKFRASPTGRNVTTYTLTALEKMGLVSPGSAKVSSFLQQGADSLVEAAVLGIFTPLYFFVAHKA
ncbi:Delta(24)-sterol C-methyltransferase [Mortierella alpina]|nr:Delta(24)-sterol C-methyltransferase [Mortierella alpina]